MAKTMVAIKQTVKDIEESEVVEGMTNTTDLIGTTDSEARLQVGNGEKKKTRNVGRSEKLKEWLSKQVSNSVYINNYSILP